MPLVPSEMLQPPAPIAPVPVAAAAVGVPDYNYFCKFFSRRAGKSPGEYRKKVTGTETKGKKQATR